jgi:hypothetical protein
MNAPDGEWVSCSHILPAYSKNKTLAARDKVPQNASLIDAKCESTPVGREHALSPIGGAESPCPLLSAIRTCGAASSIRAFSA